MMAEEEALDAAAHALGRWFVEAGPNQPVALITFQDIEIQSFGQPSIWSGREGDALAVTAKTKTVIRTGEAFGDVSAEAQRASSMWTTVGGDDRVSPTAEHDQRFSQQDDAHRLIVDRVRSSHRMPATPKDFQFSLVDHLEGPRTGSKTSMAATSTGPISVIA